MPTACTDGAGVDPAEQTPRSTPPDEKRRRRHRLRAAIVFLAIVVALFLPLPRLAGQAHTVDLVRDASPALLVVAVVFEVGALLFYSLLFRRLLRLLQFPVTLLLSLRINVAGLAAAHLFSAGGVGGAAVQYRVLQKRGMPHSLVLIAVIFQNAFAYYVLYALFGMGLLTLILRGEADDVAIAFAAAFVVLLTGLSFYGFWLLAHPSSLRRTAHRVVGWLGRRWERMRVPDQRLEGWLDGVVDGWRRLRRDGRRHWRTLGLSVGYWGCDILCLLTVMLAFHQWVPVYYLVIAYGIAYVVGTVSPTPGGLGAVEGVMMAMLVSFGMQSGAAVAVVLTYRLINFWLPIPFGLLSYAHLRRAWH